jgi:hypothetical protein
MTTFAFVPSAWLDTEGWKRPFPADEDSVGILTLTEINEWEQTVVELSDDLHAVFNTIDGSRRYAQQVSDFATIGRNARIE